MPGNSSRHGGSVQVENWNNRGSSVPAHAYNSTIDLPRKERIVKDIACGEPMIVYTTPESLLKDQGLREALAVRARRLLHCPRRCFVYTRWHAPVSASRQRPLRRTVNAMRTRRRPRRMASSAA